MIEDNQLRKTIADYILIAYILTISFITWIALESRVNSGIFLASITTVLVANFVVQGMIARAVKSAVIKPNDITIQGK